MCNEVVKVVRIGRIFITLFCANYSGVTLIVFDIFVITILSTNSGVALGF